MHHPDQQMIAERTGLASENGMDMVRLKKPSQSPDTVKCETAPALEILEI
jgi:hypothetical protein